MYRDRLHQLPKAPFGKPYWSGKDRYSGLFPQHLQGHPRKPRISPPIRPPKYHGNRHLIGRSTVWTGGRPLGLSLRKQRNDRFRSAAAK